MRRRKQLLLFTVGVGLLGGAVVAACPAHAQPPPQAMSLAPWQQCLSHPSPRFQLDDPERSDTLLTMLEGCRLDDTARAAFVRQLFVVVPVGDAALVRRASMLLRRTNRLLSGFESGRARYQDDLIELLRKMTEMKLWFGFLTCEARTERVLQAVDVWLVHHAPDTASGIPFLDNTVLAAHAPFPGASGKSSHGARDNKKRPISGAFLMGRLAMYQRRACSVSGSRVVP